LDLVCRNAGVRVLFNLDDFETADYWSKFIGGDSSKRSARRRTFMESPKSRVAAKRLGPF